MLSEYNGKGRVGERDWQNSRMAFWISCRVINNKWISLCVFRFYNINECKKPLEPHQSHTHTHKINVSKCTQHAALLNVMPCCVQKKSHIYPLKTTTSEWWAQAYNDCWFCWLVEYVCVCVCVNGDWRDSHLIFRIFYGLTDVWDIICWVWWLNIKLTIWAVCWMECCVCVCS